MKKLIILLLALTLILGVFVSCNKRYLYIDDETSSSPIESIYETSNEETSNEKTSESTSEETNEPPKTSDTAVTVDTIESIDGTEGGTTEIPEIEYPSEYNYTVVKRGDQYYMVFDSYDIAPPDLTYFGDGGIYISLDKLKNEIPNGILDDSDKRFLLRYFASDQVRDEGFKLYDIENIWIPILPYGLELENGVNWIRDIYIFNAEGGIEDNAMSAKITVLTKQRYEDMFHQENTQSMTVLQKNNATYSISQRTSQYQGKTRYHYSIWCSDGYFFAKFDVNSDVELNNDQLLSFGLQRI